MPVTAPPLISSLPTPPDPNDRATFNARAYPWSIAQQTIATEIGALSKNVFDNATAAESAAVAAESDADSAALSALSASSSAASAAAHAASLPAGTINDSLTDNVHAWSSNKIVSAIADAVNDWPPIGAIVGLTATSDTLTIDGRQFLRAGLAVHPSTVPGWPAWATPPDTSFPVVSSGAVTTIRALACAGSSGVWIMSYASELRRSTDHGATWVPVTGGFSGTVRVLAFGNGVWVGSAEAGVIMRSTDGGITWGAVTSGFSASYAIRAMGTDGAGVWVAGNEIGDMRRSTDGGVTWGSVTSGYSAGQSFEEIVFGNGVWLAIGSGGTRRSTDGGVTWGSVATGLSSAAGAGMATDGAGTWVIGGAAGAMKRSTDNGATFTSVTSGFSSSIIAIASDGAGNWWAGGYNEGIRTSTDNGVTWSALSHSFGTDTVEVIKSHLGIVTIAAGGGVSTPVMQRRRYAIGIDGATANQYLRIA